MEFVKGETTEEKFKSIDRILSRFGRRLHKTVVGVIPPDLTFNYVDIPPESGILLRTIFPSGRLTKGFMYIENYVDRTPVTFVAQVDGLKNSQSRSFITRKQLLVMDPNLILDMGDRLTFKVLEPEKISGIWIGFLFHIEVKDSIKETYLIDQIDELSKEHFAEVSDEE